jgi:hypothetical protein
MHPNTSVLGHVPVTVTSTATHHVLHTRIHPLNWYAPGEIAAEGTTLEAAIQGFLRKLVELRFIPSQEIALLDCPEPGKRIVLTLGYEVGDEDWLAAFLPSQRRAMERRVEVVS